MATARDIRKNAYCDEVLGEIAYMIQNIHDLKAHAAEVLEEGSALARAHERHLADISDYLDWKLQILATACPFEWKGLGETVQDVVSVNQPDISGPEFSGGYVGG